MLTTQSLKPFLAKSKPPKAVLKTGLNPVFWCLVYVRINGSGKDSAVVVPKEVKISWKRKVMDGRKKTFHIHKL